MILLNLSHPLTDQQKAQLKQLTGQPIERLIERMPRFDVNRPFAGQVISLLDELGLTSEAWQKEPVLLVPPALNFATAAVLAELHGRCGYFVPIVRLRPVEGSLPPRFEVAEVLNLQAIRDAARTNRM